MTLANYITMAACAITSLAAYYIGWYANKHYTKKHTPQQPQTLFGLQEWQLKLYAGIIQKYPTFFSELNGQSRKHFEDGIHFALKHLEITMREDTLRSIEDDMVALPYLDFHLEKERANDIDKVMTEFVNSFYK